MRTFDRAMYAIFLLVLLADVAHGQSAVQTGRGVRDQLTPRAMSSAECSPAAATLREFLARRSDGSRTSSSVRDLGQEILSIYRATTVKYRLSQARSSETDRFHFAMQGRIDWLPVEELSSSRILLAELSPPGPVIFDHSGNPAP